MDEVDKLIEDLKSADPDLRILAIKSLGEIRDARAVDPLINILTEDEPHEIRWFASRALVDVGTRSILPFIDKLNEGDIELFWISERFLNQILERLSSLDSIKDFIKDAEEGMYRLRGVHEKQHQSCAENCISKIIARAMEKKNSIFRENLVLDGLPKPLKRGNGMYRAVTEPGRRVRNG
jgi:hypothetical protein